MVQVQQVAAAQEEAVVLAQALLDRERVAAEEREKAQLQAQLAAAQSAGENAQLIAELKDSLKTTTEAFMHALGSSGGGGGQASAEVLAEMRGEHSRQLQSVVDAFTDALATAARTGGGGGGGGGAVASRVPTPTRQPSPVLRGRGAGAGGSPSAGGVLASLAGKAGGLTVLAGDGGAKDGAGKESSTSAVESDYTADFEDLNEQSIAEDELAGVQSTPGTASKHSSLQGRVLDAGGADSRSYGRASPVAASHASRSHASLSVRVDDDIDEATALASMLHDDTIEDQVADEDVSRSMRVVDSSIVSERGAAPRPEGSRASRHQSFANDYSDDFEEQYTEDFEPGSRSRVSDSRVSRAGGAAAARAGGKESGRVASPSIGGHAAKGEASGGDAHGQDGLDVSLVMGELPEAMQRDAATRNGIGIVQQSTKDAHVRAQQQVLLVPPHLSTRARICAPLTRPACGCCAYTVSVRVRAVLTPWGRRQLSLLRLQEQAVDERAHAQLSQIARQHKALQSAQQDHQPLATQTAASLKQGRLDQEEKSLRMRLAADKADLHRQRAQVKAELMRRLLDLQEQSNAFIASRRETLVLKGVLLPQSPQAELFRLEQQPPKGVDPQESAQRHRRAGTPQRTSTPLSSGSPQHSRRGDDDGVAEEVEGEEAYASDGFESVASDLLEGLGLDDVPAALDAEEQQLQMESVRQLTRQLGRVDQDPTGQLLQAREKSAADKRAYALMLLAEKEAAVGRRRRELHVEAEERRTADLLQRALRMDVDLEARQIPPADGVDDSGDVWDMTRTPQPGTPASFAGDFEPPPPSMLPAGPGALATPPRVVAPASVHVASVARPTPAEMQVGVSHVSSDDDADITPPRSVSSVRSPDSQGLFVQTAYDPLSAVGPRALESVASDVSDQMSVDSFEVGPGPARISHSSEQVGLSARIGFRV